jgi:hypothetical protein
MNAPSYIRANDSGADHNPTSLWLLEQMGHLLIYTLTAHHQRSYIDTPSPEGHVMFIDVPSDSHAQTAFDIFSKWSVVAVPVGGLLISFLGLLFQSRTEKDKPTPVPPRIVDALHDAKMQVAINHLEAKVSDRIERQAKRSLRLQMVTALILLLLIAGINGYLWIVTRQLQTAIQPDQMHAAIAAAQESKKTISKPLTPPQGIAASQKMKRQRPNPKPLKADDKPQAATPDQ